MAPRCGNVAPVCRRPALGPACYVSPQMRAEVLATKLGWAAPCDAVICDLERQDDANIARFFAHLNRLEPNLQELVLHFNAAPSAPLTAAVYLPLQNFAALRRLELRRSQPLTGPQLQVLVRSLPPQLTHLKLNGVGSPQVAIGEALSHVALPASLRELWLLDNDIDCLDYLALAGYLATHPRLELLHLGGRNEVDAKAVASSRQPLPQIELLFGARFGHGGKRWLLP